MSWQEALAAMNEHGPRIRRAVELQEQVWLGQGPAEQPLLLTCQSDADFDRRFSAFNTMETHFDGEKMFMSGLREAMLAAMGGAQAVPSMRANMGCGIVPTLLGLRQQLFPDKMPWVTEHLDKATLARMEPYHLAAGEEMQAALSHMELMGRRLAGGPCRVFPLDIQGAFDTAHIVYGDAIFYDIYDDAPFVHHLLELSCCAAETAMDACLARIPDSDRYVAHYNGLVIPRSLGGLKLSEDTSTLLNADAIAEFVSPYLHRLLARFGGGYVHYCGKNPHLFETVMAEPLAHGINFGNPEMHDMEAVLRRCAALRKVYYGGAPRLPGEGRRQWFARLLHASQGHGSRWLLLQHSCASGDLEQVQADWQAACAG